MTLKTAWNFEISLPAIPLVTAYLGQLACRELFEQFDIAGLLVAEIIARRLE